MAKQGGGADGPLMDPHMESKIEQEREGRENKSAKGGGGER